jgi:hypothetical protein
MLTVLFGSNWLIDTNGIVTFEDKSKKIIKELFRVELRADNQPMVTVEVRDEKDTLLGKVYRSTSFVSVNPDYETATEMDGSNVKRMELRNKKTKKLFFELINQGSRIIKTKNDEVTEYTIEINGLFHIKGCPFVIEANRHYLDINTNKIIGCKKFGGGGLKLTPNSIMI